MMLKEDNEQNNDNDQKQNSQHNNRDVGHKFDASIHRARSMNKQFYRAISTKTNNLIFSDQIIELVEYTVYNKSLRFLFSKL